MKVSVIIPSFRMGRYIGEALESVGKQTMPDWEVIVVDDCGPEDGTAATVAEFAKAHPERRVVFIRHEQNQGVSAARNTAILIAESEFLAFLDPDDAWESKYLSRQLEVFERAPDTGLAYTGTFMMDSEGLPLHEWKPPEDYADDWPRNLFWRNFINPSASVSRTAAVRAVGGFDTAPEIQHVEDWDLWIRLVEAGVGFQRSDAPLVRYRQHSGAACADGEKFRLREEALRRKHGAHPLMIDFFLRRLQELDLHRQQLEDDHRKLVADHHRTVDFRLKSWLKGLIGKS